MCEQICVPTKWVAHINLGRVKYVIKYNFQCSFTQFVSQIFISFILVHLNFEIQQHCVFSSHLLVLLHTKLQLGNGYTLHHICSQTACRDFFTFESSLPPAPLTERRVHCCCCVVVLALFTLCMSKSHGSTNRWANIQYLFVQSVKSARLWQKHHCRCGITSTGEEILTGWGKC